MPNTEHDTPTSFELPGRYQPPARLDDKLTDAVAQLSEQLTNEKDGRREERFYWVFAVCIALDCAVLPHQPHWLAVSLFLLQLCIMPGLAAHLGVDWAVKGLEQGRRLISDWIRRGKDDDGKD